MNTNGLIINIATVIWKHAWKVELEPFTDNCALKNNKGKCMKNYSQIIAIYPKILHVTVYEQSGVFRKKLKTSSCFNKIL